MEERVSLAFCNDLYSGAELVELMYENNKTPTTDFLLKILNSLRESDMYEEYRQIIHRNVGWIELWDYFIEYSVETQRVTEILESLQFYKKKSVIGNQIVALYNKLAADQIRYTIFKNQ